jgi:CBS domain containing-hemolysin-like protein
MENTAFFWFTLNLISIAVLAFYSMMEMACVSFNKVRLQYYVSKNIKQAVWLNYLLENPSRLFGTTLIGVNIALFTGSECARQFYSSLGIDPDWAPLTQVILVVIFGELAPMFAARRFPEHMAMLGVPLIYLSAKIMTPFLWFLGGISKLCNLIIGGKEHESDIFLTQEELQKILEEQDEDYKGEHIDLNTIASNIFEARKKIARDIMQPLNTVPNVPVNTTVGMVRSILGNSTANYALTYHQEPNHVVGIALPRDLVRAPDNRKIRDYSRPPWFVTEQTLLIQILNQFRSNNQHVAIILDFQGNAAGLINLDDIMEEIVGKTEFRAPTVKKKRRLVVDVTFPADYTVGEFNKKFHTVLDAQEQLTLVELMEEKLGHRPAQGESVVVGSFELEVKEASLLEVKTISITSR